MPSLGHRVDSLHHRLFQQEHRGGVFCSIRSQLIQRTDAFHCDPVQPDGQIAPQRWGLEHRALPGGPLVQAAAQQGQIFLPGGETRRHRMSAKPLQQISTSADALMQVKALDTASAALALALFVH